jgi:hypothetical protein
MSFAIAEYAKFEELRAKTDRQLVQVVRIQLERGLRLACDRAKRPEAARAYSEACSLLSKVYNLTDAEKHCVEAGFVRLREALSSVARDCDTQVRHAGA